LEAESLQARTDVKAYLMVTGAVFGLLTVAHVWRAIVESGLIAREPWFILITALSAALCIWAFTLLRRSASTV
jgi:dolichyl-phosphate-mannose--protein O-mannosyl transferase